MRYRLTGRGDKLTGSGDWRMAFASQGGSGGDFDYRFGKYFSPGAITSPSSYFAGLGQTTDDSGTTDSSTTSTPSWLQNLVTGFTQYKLNQQQIDQINQINQVNIQRAAQGLPPLPVPTFSPGINVGLTSDTQTLLLYGGLGVAALWIFSTMMRRR
jgi:hypothetical protein